MPQTGPLRNRFLNAAVIVACAGLALAYTGCTQDKENAKEDGHHGHSHGHSHAHATVGPHGGTIVEWGDHEHHLELTFDRAKRQATVYVLDHDVKKAQPTALEKPLLKLNDVPTPIPLVASPLDGETAEKSSRYIATHEALAGDKLLKGAISGSVGEKPYFGSFNEEDKKEEKKPDDHADHKDHEHEKDAHKHDADKHGDDKKDADKQDVHDDHDHPHDDKEHHDHAAQNKSEEHAGHDHKDHGHKKHDHDDHADHDHAEPGKNDSATPPAPEKQSREGRLRRTEQLMHTSENLRLFTEDWERFWFMNLPEPLPAANQRQGSGSMP